MYAGHGKPIKVACVGDSITHWRAGGQRNRKADYPSVLQKLLGDGYEVMNFGRGGATMQKAGNKPYWREGEWRQALSSNADIFVIMLGTNDSKSFNWKCNGRTGPKSFEADYKDMISRLRALDTSPTLYTAIPPPAYSARAGFNQKIINTVLPPLIEKINDDMKLPHRPINVFEALGGAELRHPGWFADKIHPTDKGSAEIAKVVHASIAAQQPPGRTLGVSQWPGLSPRESAALAAERRTADSRSGHLCENDWPGMQEALRKSMQESALSNKRKREDLEDQQHLEEEELDEELQLALAISASCA